MLNLAPGTQFLDVPGARVAYDILIPSQGPIVGLLVLVNGYQRPRSDYRAFRKRLAAVCPQVATLSLDNRGSGETELLDSRSADGPLGPLEGQKFMDQMAQDVVSLATAAKTTLGLEQMVLLGISMGGMIAQSALLGEPELFQGLVLVSTTSGKSNPKAQAEFAPWPKDFEGMNARMSRYFGPKFLKSNPLLVEMMSRNMLKSVLQGGSDDSSRRQFLATQAFDVSDKLHSFTSPTLILSGDEDHIMPVSNAHKLKELIPKSSLHVYEDVGHLLLVEAPDAFVQDVAVFLGEKFNWKQNHS